MGRVFKRGKKWYIDYSDSTGKRIRRVVADTKRDAERILVEKERKKYFTRENIPIQEKISLKELFEQFQSMKKKRVNPRTMDGWNSRLRFWEEKHKYKIFSPLSRLEIERIIDSLAVKLSSETINNYVNVLRQVYQYAVELKVINENPVKDVKRLQEAPRKVPRFFSEEEVKRLLEYSNPFYKDLWLFFLYTGMRRNEARFLEWSDIDFEQEVISVKNKESFTTKSKRSRIIPIHPIVKNILTVRRKESGLVFESPEGGIFSREVWRGVLLRVAKRANVKNVTLHTFRHTFASWLVMEGIDLPTIANLLGHSDIKTTMIYSHLAPDHIKKAINRLPSPLSD